MGYDNILRKVHKQKQCLIIVFVCILFIQVFLVSYINGLAIEIKNQHNQYVENVAKAERNYIDGVIRPQERIMLSSIRESWASYLLIHPDIKLLKTDNSGLYIFKNNENKSIGFNPTTMYKVKQDNGLYNIYDLDSNKVILNNSSMQWNTQEVKNILDIIASPIKAFGPTGDVLIFDSNTGEVIINNSEDCKESKQTIGDNGKRYVTLEWKHPNNKNPLYTKDLVDKYYMWKVDSDSTTRMINLFEEPTKMIDPNDFKSYPLGKYHREFQEKIILPYQTVGIEGQDMQITIVMGAQEQELTNTTKNIKKFFNSLESKNYISYQKIISVPIISIMLSLIVIMFTLFILKINNFTYKKENK